MSQPDIKKTKHHKKLHDNTLTCLDLPLINIIDKYFTHTRLHAKNSIRKYTIPHHADWSVILHQAYFTYQYWLAIYKHRILGDDYSTRIKKSSLLFKSHPRLTIPSSSNKTSPPLNTRLTIYAKIRSNSVNNS